MKSTFLSQMTRQDYRLAGQFIFILLILIGETTICPILFDLGFWGIFVYVVQLCAVIPITYLCAEQYCSSMIDVVRGVFR